MTFTCNRVCLHCSIATFTQVKDLNTSSPGNHRGLFVMSAGINAALALKFASTNCL